MHPFEVTEGKYAFWFDDKHHNEMIKRGQNKPETSQTTMDVSTILNVPTTKVEIPQNNYIAVPDNLKVKSPNQLPVPGNATVNFDYPMPLKFTTTATPKASSTATKSIPESSKVIQPQGDPYEYQVQNGTWKAKKKDETEWERVPDKAIETLNKYIQ
jgi:hypothetical protein